MRSPPQIDAAVAAAEGAPSPGPEALFDHVYADPPERVVQAAGRSTTRGQETT